MRYFEELNSILTRYQRHVAEYDKAKWELTVEQRILHGINHIPKKSAKLQSELIDLDLVRGSAFPKAKPKHGLFKVTKQGLLRFLFLPFYHNWWTEQTSKSLFSVFLVLYVAQIIIAIIHFNLLPFWLATVLYYGFGDFPVPATPGNSSSIIQEITLPTRPVYGPSPDPTYNPNTEAIVTSEIQTSEILSPLFLMIVLTILHSQIVATYGSNRNSQSGGGSEGNNFKQRSNSGTLIHQKFLRGRRRPSRFAHRRRSFSKNNFQRDRERENSQSQEVPSQTVSTNRRVFFEDESKSWTSSNSDKDEGIVDEGHENQDSGETEQEQGQTISCVRRLSDAVHNLVEKNIIEANVNATIRKFAEEEQIATRQKNQVDLPRLTKEDLENGTNVNNSSDQHNGHGPFVQRSNLRKRTISKSAEVNTSCADCSSNNNESSSDEEYREATMEDDEVRSKSEWTAVTTNSEDDDYEEENINSEDEEEMKEQLHDHPFAWEFQKHSKKGAISPSCAAADKISCTIWDGVDAMKADLTVLDISSSIIAKVERAKENSDYIYLGMIFSFLLAFLPCLWRLGNSFEIDDFHIQNVCSYVQQAFYCAYGETTKFRLVIFISIAERLCLSFFVFFLLAVAEKTYKQRFLYAKLFSRLTSSRKARKSGIPHFRLNKVRNIKTWLSIRSYLQRRGPQRSVDTIVSGAFITTLFLIFFLSIELLKDSNRMYYLYNIEVISWAVCLGFFLMRYMTLGSRIGQKYRNNSVIITEQLNLYLKMEQKPHKKDELLVANNVLKLASELLKELDDPFKISSFASNPYLYNVTRLVILSAFSGVLSEMLGFKLKLYKIKLK